MVAFHRGICTLGALLPVRSMREGYAFVSVCVYIYIYMCVCVSSKNTLVCVLPLENLHENTLCSFSTEFIVLRCFLCWQALLERLIHGFLKLRVLLRAFYGIVGVSPNLLSISTSSLSLNLSGAVDGLQ